MFCFAMAVTNFIFKQMPTCFEDLPKSYFLNGSKTLEKRLEKCIELADYLKNILFKIFFLKFTE